MYDEDLANRVRGTIGTHQAFSERKMFGGLCFMLGGNMACGVVGNDLIVRTGPNRYEEALRQPHVRPMDFTGRPMRGMVFVGQEALDDAGLARWIEMAASVATALPPKSGRTTAQRSSRASKRR